MLKYFFRSLIDWVFRRRSVGLTLVRIGVPLLGIVLFGLTVGVSIPTANGPFVFSWDSSGSSAELSWGVFGVVTLIILLGVALIIRDIRREDREKVIVIEARGLRDWQGEALERAVPTSVRGRREQVMIDVRQGLVDGQIVSPETAIRRLSSLPEDIARRCDGLDRADLSFVVGGLAPVPLLFLLGVIVDDESQTLIMDWDRQRRIWRPLDEEDDGKRFAVAGLDALTPGTTRVALCVSASYDVLEADVRLVEPTAPIIRLVLDSRSTASHWSEQKQQQLAQQFLDIVMSIARQGVTDIALFLAAPASISLRLGTVYDKRNLPRLELNQFEQADPKKYPWAVRMPVAGVTQAQLIQR
ncbi:MULTISPECIES: SAVED domain-containing protein [Pseudomonadota]|uniref:2-methylthioadenine synthetase n=1 Tax=Stutzerimonas stutzeri TaxID=316 RepID=A0A2N8SZD4_STUST|nr:MULTISPECIES: SAVED domain-containing protein [Pseudomonadota]MCQ4249759.1 SAVED domain-containing protein [Stutzerimonas stutzeri]PNG07856.1 2-methylthioadenine synthetase [Stutzerimonas stutzeri]